MKLIAFGASNSKNSINKSLAHFAADQINGSNAHKLDLNDFDIPLYGIDHEKENGIPEDVNKLKTLIDETDGIILSLAEHNGSFSAAFKSVYDWLSRIDGNVWQGKPMLLMATSPGGRGGIGVLEHAKALWSRKNENIVTFSLPSFGNNFDNGIVDEELKGKFEEALKEFVAKLG